MASSAMATETTFPLFIRVLRWLMADVRAMEMYQRLGFPSVIRKKLLGGLAVRGSAFQVIYGAILHSGEGYHEPSIRARLVDRSFAQ